MKFLQSIFIISMSHTILIERQLRLKRIFDVVLAIVLIFLALPIMLFLASTSLFLMGRPVIFKHTRPGKDEVPFSLLKFRTMTDKRDANGVLLNNEERITKYGLFLRKSSLDEIPSLFNVLIGDMSFVGPRPLLMRYLPYYTEEQKERHKVRPGVTGLAQANGRNSLSWEEKFEYDIEYVRNITFAGDLKIILKTIKTVLSGIGVTDNVVSVGMQPLDEYLKESRGVANGEP